MAKQYAAGRAAGLCVCADKSSSSGIAGMRALVDPAPAQVAQLCLLADSTLSCTLRGSLADEYVWQTLMIADL